MKLTMFNTEEELQELTGLTHDELWDAGFDLDDWDIGFQTEEHMPNAYEDDGTALTWWLTQSMDDYCCGYGETKHKDKYYYLVYHA